MRKRDTVYVCNWPEGIMPEAIDDLMPLDSVELKKAKGTWDPRDTESNYPCPKCGFSLGIYQSRDTKCRDSHYACLESCAYCKHHGFSGMNYKIIGGECMFCGPTRIARVGGKYPRWQVFQTESIRGGQDTTRRVVYDLDIKLPGPES